MGGLSSKPEEQGKIDEQKPASEQKPSTVLSDDSKVAEKKEKITSPDSPTSAPAETAPTVPVAETDRMEKQAGMVIEGISTDKYLLDKTQESLSPTGELAKKRMKEIPEEPFMLQKAPTKKKKEHSAGMVISTEKKATAAALPPNGKPPMEKKKPGKEGEVKPKKELEEKAVQALPLGTMEHGKKLEGKEKKEPEKKAGEPPTSAKPQVEKDTRGIVEKAPPGKAKKEPEVIKVVPLSSAKPLTGSKERLLVENPKEKKGSAEKVIPKKLYAAKTGKTGKDLPLIKKGSGEKLAATMKTSSLESIAQKAAAAKSSSEKTQETVAKKTFNIVQLQKKEKSEGRAAAASKLETNLKSKERSISKGLEKQSIERKNARGRNSKAKFASKKKSK